ncbi:MAG: AraC family transcriptional regulator [Burkholderiaceae bacterium]|nr:AraC family transcriptional regulator [Burkholderiaceae bacterium]
MSERLFLRLPDDPPCALGTTVPAKTLRAFDVPPALRTAVAHATAYEERFAQGKEVVERVLPDGASRLLIVLQSGSASIHIAGARASPVVLTMRGHMHGLSVTLQPGATLGLFGVPADELAGRTLPWDDIADKAHRHLPDQLAMAADDVARVNLVLQSLRAMRRQTETSSFRLAEYAASALRASAGGISIRALADKMSLSERRLQQVFAAQLGLAPSVWRRLQRLHGTLRLLRTAETPQWAQLALRAGYYDQSHLINEFRALCGLTPQQFMRRVVSDSSNTAIGAKG